MALCGDRAYIPGLHAPPKLHSQYQIGQPVQITKKLGKGLVLCLLDVIPSPFLGELNVATCIKTVLVI